LLGSSTFNIGGGVTIGAGVAALPLLLSGVGVVGTAGAEGLELLLPPPPPPQPETTTETAMAIIDNEYRADSSLFMTSSEYLLLSLAWQAIRLLY
jgi:hypothetical protein